MQLFIVVLLPLVTVVAAPAPGCHGDRDKDHRPRQNCTAAGFSRVPEGLEPSTKVLLFPHNLFSSLAWASFQLFAELYEVDLTGNQLPQVPPSASPVLPTLSVLRLGSNRISALPDGCFSACPALSELYLDNNTIRSLSHHTFSGLSRLEILELSSNHIQVLPQLLLHPLPAIEFLYLEKNQIQVVPDDWFSQKEEVPYLYLSANPWACSCALGYLRDYLDQYEFNVYTRSGPIITNDPDSVVCESPPRFRQQPVMSLSPSELCPSTSPPPARPRTTTAAPTSAPPPATPTKAFVAPTTEQVPSTQPARGPVVIATSTEGERPGTRTSVPAAGPTTDRSSRTPWSWSQPTSQPDRHTRSGGLVAALLTSAPPLATTNAFVALTTDLLPSTQTAGLPVVIATPAEGGRGMAAGLQGAGRFCVWLFAGCFLLCLLSAAIVLATSGRLVFLYWTAYRPLKASLRRRRAAGLRLLSNQRREEAGPGGGGRLYRSVLFVHREAEEQVGFYRRTLQRLLSREDQLDTWTDVTEECGVRPGGRRSYSVILRQEAEPGAEQLEWVLGAWEESTGGGARGRLDPGLLS